MILMAGQANKNKFFPSVFRSLRPAFMEFRKNDPLRMAGATAFFTVFALPPILFIIIQLFGLFTDRRNVGRALLGRLVNTLGEDGAGQVRQVLRSIRGFSDSWLVIITGFLFLLFVATTLFIVIKNSFNQIWQVGLKPEGGIGFQLKLRLRSLAVIIIAGILLLTDVFIDSLELIAGDYADTLILGSGFYFEGALSELTGAAIVALWFIIIFRFLGDGRPSWKAAITGGVLTGIFFTAGKLLLWYLLVDSNISNLFGAAGSFVLILLFVFYSSFILYYGASFIYVYSSREGMQILPASHAYEYTVKEV